jgi:hypothetical protein
MKQRVQNKLVLSKNYLKLRNFTQCVLRYMGSRDEVCYDDQIKNTDDAITNLALD